MQYLLKYESFSSINLTRNFIIDAFFILKEEFNIEYGVAELLEGSAYLVRIRMDKVIFTKENPTEEKFKTDFNSICERLSKLGLIIIKDNDSPNRGDRINKQFNFIKNIF